MIFNDGGRQILEYFGYPFCEADGSIPRYSSDIVYHLHTEGALIIDAICSQYQLVLGNN
jgi:hypothetical protein